jgi:hypothetical protein
VDNLKELQEVQRFRAVQFSQQFGVSFEDGLDQDIYDFGCEHAVLRENGQARSWHIPALNFFRDMKYHKVIVRVSLKLFRNFHIYPMYLK